MVILRRFGQANDTASNSAAGIARGLGQFMASQAQIVHIGVSNHGPTDDLMHVDLWNYMTMHPQHPWAHTTTTGVTKSKEGPNVECNAHTAMPECLRRRACIGNNNPYATTIHTPRSPCATYQCVLNVDVGHAVGTCFDVAQVADMALCRVGSTVGLAGRVEVRAGRRAPLRQIAKFVDVKTDASTPHYFAASQS